MIVKFRKLHLSYNEKTNTYEEPEVCFSETIIKQNKIIGSYLFYLVEDSEKEPVSIKRKSKYVLCEEADKLILSEKPLKELKKYIKEFNKKNNENYNIIIFSNNEKIIKEVFDE